MAICPECRAGYGDDVQRCAEHGCELVPDDLFLPADVPLAPGMMVGEYRIDRKLGAGTFGDVYAGEHPLIGKRVAIKVLNQRFAADPVMISRFVAEARAVNKIRQRNIIDIFSFGVLPGLDRHYFVMELLDGLTLGELMDRSGRLPLGVVLPIVREIAGALDAVHEAGITHRDLKPDNVFLATERDGSYFPKLLDFGIAKLIGDDAAHQTGPGMVMGTPRYMSPEQARGKPADHRADIYALGVMIHEMLTSAPLFVGESSIDVLLMHATDAPPRMSSVCPDLPPELDAPVLAMLEKSPKNRPSSAGEAVAALAAVAATLGPHRLPTVASRSDARGPRTNERAREREQEQEQEQEQERGGRDRRTPPGDDDQHRTRRIEADRSTGARAGVPARERVDAAGRLRPRERGATRPLRAVDRGAVGRRDLERDATARSIAALEARRRRARPGLRGLHNLVVRAPAAARSRQRRDRRAVARRVGRAAAFSDHVGAPDDHAPPPLEPTAKLDVVAPQVVELRLATRPADVEVWLGDRKLGSSTAPLPLPRGAERVVLSLKKAGFKDESLSLVPDRDQSRDVTLAPLSARRDAPAVKPATSAGRIDQLLQGRD